MIKSYLKKVIAFSSSLFGVPSIAAASGQNGRILMYHRVIDPQQSSILIQPGMYVTPKTFAMQMEFLAKTCNVISLEEFVDSKLAGKILSPKTVAITFDDGWLDNYTNAFPVLKAFSLPATIFLSTSYINSSEILWTDVVGVAVQAITNGYDMKEALAGMGADADSNDRHVVELFYELVLFGQKEKAEHLVLDRVIDTLKDYPPEQCEKIIWVLKLAFGSKICSVGRVFLSWDEVREMSKSQITFGSHSHSHKNLIRLTSDEVRNDVGMSRQLLNDNGALSTSLFCYPGGYLNFDTQQVLKGYGIKAALKVGRKDGLSENPPLFGRVGIHEDVSNTRALFENRMWVNKLF